MNTTIKLVGLGATVAIALLLPTQARANTPAPTDDPAALTSAEPLPTVVLEDVAEEGGPEAIDLNPAAVLEDVVEEGEPEAIDLNPPDPVVDPTAADPSIADPTAIEAVNPDASPSSDTSSQANDPLLPYSTSSSDLQPIAAPVASEAGLPPLAQPFDTVQTTSDPAQSNRWHFLAVPYIYIPFSISGTATFEGESFRNNFVGDFTDPSRDFDFSPSEITEALRNSLNFAFLSGFEAWTPNYNVGIIANLDYVSLSSESTVIRDVRIPGAADFIPTEVNAALDTQLWRADLAGSYRFYDRAQANPEGIRSEFDLGPFVFDVLGGLSLISINTQLDLSTNLGGNGEFDSSRTIVSPLIGGRVRWNANPKFAVIGAGGISGFGISGLTQYGIQGGIDWMFSGDTTLGAGYRFSFLDYNSDQIDLDVNQSGPYLNVGFRF